jgi:hypothetical protein
MLNVLLVTQLLGFVVVLEGDGPDRLRAGATAEPKTKGDPPFPSAAGGHRPFQHGEADVEP